MAFTSAVKFVALIFMSPPRSYGLQLSSAIICFRLVSCLAAGATGDHHGSVIDARGALSLEKPSARKDPVTPASPDAKQTNHALTPDELRTAAEKDLAANLKKNVGAGHNHTAAVPHHIEKRKISPLVRHDRSSKDAHKTPAKPREDGRATHLDTPCALLRSYRGPSQCPQGNARWSDTTLLNFTSIFFQEWKLQEAALPKHCCMGINHMFGLSYLVHTLKPSLIIESGVSAGHQTFLLRTAVGKSVPILAFDPLDPATAYPNGGDYGHWKDTSGMTRYFVGEKFQDFAEVDWARLIPDLSIRQRTLVVLDDRQSSVERIRVMQKFGFKWAYYVENYPLQAATPSSCGSSTRSAYNSRSGLMWPFGGAYSPNAVCGAPLPGGAEHVLYKDKFGAKCALLTPDQHKSVLTYMQKSLKTYFEFPPLFTPCADSPRSALLGEGTGDAFEHRLARYGLPTTKLEVSGYAHVFPAFIELVDAQNSSDPFDGMALSATVAPTSPIDVVGESPFGAARSGALTIALPWRVGAFAAMSLLASLGSV